MALHGLVEFVKLKHGKNFLAWGLILVYFPSLLSNSFFQSQRYTFLKLCGMMATCLFLTIQCSWNPEVETLVHNSQQGRITLQTSSALHMPPKHPQSLPPSLIKQILGGISKAQERGILQELLLSSSAELPAFSQGQIDFLTPQLVEAFSQATPEELIVFKTLGDEQGGIRVTGTVAVFSPTIFFLTLKDPKNYPGNLAKMSSSSRKLQEKTTLKFSKKQATLQWKDAQRFMTVSSKDSWIAIDYADLSRSMGENQQEEEQQTIPQTNRQTEQSPQDMDLIQKQLEDLRNTVEEQAEKIRRLQEADH